MIRMIGRDRESLTAEGRAPSPSPYREISLHGRIGEWRRKLQGTHSGSDHGSTEAAAEGAIVRAAAGWRVFAGNYDDPTGKEGQAFTLTLNFTPSASRSGCFDIGGTGRDKWGTTRITEGFVARSGEAYWVEEGLWGTETRDHRGKAATLVITAIVPGKRFKHLAANERTGATNALRRSVLTSGRFDPTLCKFLGTYEGTNGVRDRVSLSVKHFRPADAAGTESKHPSGKDLATELAELEAIRDEPFGYRLV